MGWKILLLITMAAGVSFADTDDGKPHFNGYWQSDAGRNLTLSINENNGKLHFVQSAGNETEDWTCGTAANQCDLPGVQKGKVSVWYNGPALVIMETRGEKVTKERLQFSADKSKLELEIVPRSEEH